MKKTLLSVCALLLATITFAQQARTAKMPIKQEIKRSAISAAPSSVASVAPSLSPSTQSVSPAAIWSEDFDAGIPATWSNSTAPWEYRGTSTMPNNTVGSRGLYNSNQTPIASPSAANGFVIFDSDYHDTGGAAQGTGLYQTPHAGELRTDNIDLSAHTDLAVKMNSYFRTFMGEAVIKFYINNQFDSQVKLHTDLEVNDANDPSDEVIVRMPLSVPGNANVQMEFVFDGATQSNQNGSGYYFWIIDDIEILPTPLHIIKLQNPVVGGFWIDYANYTGAGLNDIVGLDYTVTPTTQLANHPYVIEGIIKNNGAADQNVTLKYEATGIGGTSGAYSGASTATSALSITATNLNDSVIVAASPSLSPSQGQYFVEIWGESDSAGTVVAHTDTAAKLIEISDYIYGKDNGEQFIDGDWIIGGPNHNWHFTTRYEMYANEQLYGLRAFITDESVPGAKVKAIIYELDSTATNGVAIMAESDDHIITGFDLGAWVDIPFVSPISLLDGFAYEFGIVGYQSFSDSVFVGTAGESLYNGEHSLFDEQGLNPNDNGTLGVPTWYYTTNTPMVRMSFDPSLTPSTVSNVKNTIFNVYPNPSNGLITITLEENKDYYLTINNVLGQTVYTTITSESKTVIDLSSFDKGIYTIELRNDDEKFSEKIIIE